MRHRRALSALALACLCLSASPVFAAYSAAPAGEPRRLHIAFGYTSRDSRGVFVVRVDGANRRQISEGLGPTRATATPRLVSGRGASGVRRRPPGQRSSKIFIVRPDGSDQEQISSGASCFGDSRPDWSAHSQHVVFQRDQCDPVEVWSVGRDGQELENLSGTIDYETVLGAEPRWSRQRTDRLRPPGRGVPVPSGGDGPRRIPQADRHPGCVR